MKRTFFTFFVTLHFFTNLHGQGVGIGTTSPDSNAILDIYSSNRGLRLPRIDSFTRIGIQNSGGLVVYDKDDQSIWYCDSLSWHELLSVRTTQLSLPGSDILIAEPSDFPGAKREGAFYFTIGDSLYLGGGTTNGSDYLSDFWKYDLTSMNWTQLANFGGGGIRFAVGLSDDINGYVATGRKSVGGVTNQVWEFNPSTNTWTQKANFPGIGRQQAAGFSIDGKGYLGTGTNLLLSATYFDFWEYNPTNDTWTQKMDVPGAMNGANRRGASTFVINDYGYLGLGVNAVGNLSDWWKYHPTQNSWHQIAEFIGSARHGAIGFSIGESGFVTGGLAITTNEVYQYTPGLDIWLLKASHNPSRPNFRFAVSSSAQTKGYYGIGFVSGANDNQLIKYLLGPTTEIALSDNNYKYFNDGTWTNIEGIVSLSNGVDSLFFNACNIEFSGPSLVRLNDTLDIIGTVDIIDGRLDIQNPINNMYNVSNYPLYVESQTTFGSYSFLGWEHTSDKRLKTDIKPLESSLRKILSLQGVSFKWKSQTDSREQIGLIAQELEKVFPEVVNENSSGYYTIAIQNLIAPMIEAIKEQQFIIDDLRRQIIDLRAELHTKR